MYVTGLFLGVNRSESAMVMVNNSLLINLLFHGFFLLLGQLIGSLSYLYMILARLSASAPYYQILHMFFYQFCDI